MLHNLITWGFLDLEGKKQNRGRGNKQSHQIVARRNTRFQRLRMFPQCPPVAYIQQLSKPIRETTRNRSTHPDTCRLSRAMGWLGLVPPRAYCLPIEQTKTSPSFYVLRPVIHIWPSMCFPVPQYCACLSFLDRLCHFLTCMQESVTLSEIFCALRKSVIWVYAQLYIREHRQDCIELGTQNVSLSDICIRITILANFRSEIPNCGFNRPLRITRQWANANSFRGEMHEQMDTLSHEVNAVSAALTVELLEFRCKLEE